MKKDSKSLEALLGHIKSAREIARKECEAGASLLNIHDSLREAEQFVAGRLKDVNDWNKAQEAQQKPAHVEQPKETETSPQDVLTGRAKKK